MVRVCEHLENQPGFRARNRIHDTWYRILHGEEPVNIGGISQRLEHRANFPAVHNDRYRNRLIGAKIIISVTPQKSGDAKSVKRAQAVENMAYFLYRELTRKRTNALFAVDSRTVDYQCWAGIGFQRIDWRDDILDMLDDAPLNKPIDGNPFVLQGPETRAVYYDENFETVAQVGEHQVSAIVASYEDLAFTKEAGFYFTSDAVEVDTAQALWDITAKVYVLETKEFVYEVVSYENKSEELSTWPNFAGRPRYSIHAGHVTSAREPHRRFRPLIHPLYRLAQERNLYKTLLGSGALQTGRPMFQEVPVGGQQDAPFILQSPGSDQKNIKFELEGGIMRQPREGYQWVPMGVPSSEWLELALTRNEREEVDHGFPAVLSPSTPLDATSGTDRSEQKEAGTDFLDPPLKERADGWTENFRLMFDQLQGAKIPITFNEKLRATGGSDVVPQTVQPDFYDGIDIEVGFRSIPASVEFAEREMMGRDVDRGVTALSSLAGFLHDDPESEMRKAAFDRVGVRMTQAAEEDAIAMAQALRGERAVQMANEAGIPLPSSDGRNQRPPTPMPGVGMSPVPVDQNSPAPSQNAPVR